MQQSGLIEGAHQRLHIVGRTDGSPAMRTLCSTQCRLVPGAGQIAGALQTLCLVQGVVGVAHALVAPMKRLLSHRNQLLTLRRLRDNKWRVIPGVL